MHLPRGKELRTEIIVRLSGRAEMAAVSVNAQQATVVSGLELANNDTILDADILDIAQTC